MPAGIPIVNDCVTGGADKALAAEQGKTLYELINSRVHEVSENGWYLVDEFYNVVMKYGADGLDVAKVTDHFKSLLGGGGGGGDDAFMEVEEDGFFIVDDQLRVGFQVTDSGVLPSSTTKGNPTSIFVAASDSNAYDKSRADIVCTGSNDQLKIQQAVDALPKCGEVVLAQGTYYIDAFRQATDGHYGAIIIPDTHRPDYRIKIRGASDSDINTVLYIKQTAYAALADGTSYSVISATNHQFSDYPKHAIFENLCISIPDNKKSIVCFDGWNFGSVRYTNCMAKARTADTYLGRALKSTDYGIIGCIGFRGTQGSNNAIDMIWSNCSSYGMGQNFAVSGEHLVMFQCAGVAGKYNYTFNYYTAGSGAFNHPMTLINCCDERAENLPYFGDNGERGHASGSQAVTMIDFNVERLSTDAIVDLAKEKTPGAWRGRIEYTLQTSYGGSGNNPGAYFWTAGHGNAIESRNQAQLLACASNVRGGYAPTYRQLLYDTTINKLLVCIDPANKTWVDALGNS